MRSLERTSVGIQQVELESLLFENRVIYLEGEIDRELVISKEKELAVLMSKGNGNVLMIINSPGGSVNDGLSLLNTMNSLPYLVDVLVLGEAYSMAAVLFTCTRGKRYIGEEARLMLHEPLVSGLRRSSLSEIRETCENLESCKKKICQLLSNRTGISMQKMNKIVKEDHYYEHNEAIKLGFADEVGSLTLAGRYGGK